MYIKKYCFADTTLLSKMALFFDDHFGTTLRKHPVHYLLLFIRELM